MLSSAVPPHPSGSRLMSTRRYLVENLRKYATLAELRRSAFFAECRAEVELLLGSPEICRTPGLEPRLRSFLRLAQWNVEKGKGFQRILEILRSDEILRWADVILLNEVDVGMARSGNRHVARLMAEALQMNLAFAPAHIELTSGTGDDLEPEGENSDCLQGNAILSRYPILDVRIVPLPACFEPFEFHEKRYGRRSCIWARLGLDTGTLWVGCTHLEVRNTPACRAQQMRHILGSLPAQRGEHCVLGGDLNANGFGRGTRWRTLMSLCHLVLRSSTVMKERLRHPELGSEPLFMAAGRAGFSWEGLNSDEVTACAPIGDLEDARLLPRFLVRLVQKRLEPYGGQLCFKLDWILGRVVRGLRTGELRDPKTGVTSRAAGCLPLNRCGPTRASDHNPIYADISI